MTDPRTILNGVEAQGLDMSQVEITYNVGELVGVVGQFVTTSTQKDIPLEPNLEALGLQPGMLTLRNFPPLTGTAAVLVNGNDLLKGGGRYRLTGWDRERSMATVTLVGNNSSIMPTLAARRLRDTDLSAFDDVWDDTFYGDYANGLWQPIVQYGRQSTGTSATASWLYPSIALDAVLTQIITAAGYTYECPDTVVAAFFEQVYLPPVSGILRNGSRWLASLVETRLFPNFGVSGAGSTTTSHSNFATSVTGTPFSPESGGACRLDYEIPFTITNTPTGIYSEDYFVSLEFGGWQVGKMVMYGATSGTFTGSLFFSKPDEPTSDFTLRMEYFISALSGTVTYNYNLAVTLPVITFTPLEDYITEIQPGDTLNFENYLPDWTQRQFLDECARLTGCTVAENVVDKTVGFYPISGLDTNRGEANDWTDIMVATDGSAETVDFDVPGVGRTTRFSYKHDSDTEERTTADYSVPGNDILPQLVEYRSAFGDSNDGQIWGGISSFVPLWQPTDSGDFTVQTISPRVLVRPQALTRAFSVDGGVDTVEFATFGPIETYGLRWQDLAPMFYAPMIRFALAPAKVTVNVLLTSTDMLQLLEKTPAPAYTPRILCPVFLRQVGAYYKIESINFVPGADVQVATLILL